MAVTHALKGTDKRAASIYIAVNFNTCVDSELLRILKRDLTAAVWAQAEREAAEQVLSSGRFFMADLETKAAE